ncbi:MAG: hypothetical protein Q9169_002352 [Polycauliona sp. 2 TL-2023]
MAPKTIHVIGSLNIDLITRTPRHPSPGETLTATSFNYGPGGKGANQAVACARLSRSNPKTQPESSSSSNSIASSDDAEDKVDIKVEMIGAIGSDFFGDYILDELKASGVGVGGVRRLGGEKTGTAVVVVEEGTGENRILITGGANASVLPASLASYLRPSSNPTSDSRPSNPDLDLDSERRANKPDLIILQLEIPLLTVISIIASAKQAGIDVLLNPAPAVQGIPRDVFRGLGHLIMNESEAGILVAGLGDDDDGAGDEKGDRNNEEGGKKEGKDGEGGKHWQGVCDRFHGLGVRNVVITLGSHGVYFSSSSSSTSSSSAPSASTTNLPSTGQHIPAAPVEKVIDTTAAGDTFVGAYAVHILGGGKGGEKGVEEAVKWANRAAARTVEREGAMGSIPWGDEVGG